MIKGIFIEICADYHLKFKVIIVTPAITFSINKLIAFTCSTAKFI